MGGCGEALHPRSAGRGGPEAHGQVREGRDLRVLLRTAPRRRHGGVGHCEVIQPASRGSRYSVANMKCSYTQRLHTRLQNSQSCEPFSECTVSRSHEFAWRVAFFFSSSGSVSAAKVGPPYSQQRATCPLLRWVPAE